MKTNQVMKRQMGAFAVYQRTIDGFFNAGDLLRQWNNTLDNPRRDMKKFIDSPNTCDFINVLLEDIAISTNVDMADIKAIKVKKGRSTSKGREHDEYWMNPYLFIKFAMWISVKFELDVIKFVSDKMLEYRNESAEAYKMLTTSVSFLVGKENLHKYIPNIARALNHIVFGEHITMARNEYGDESQQRELWKLEIKLAELVDDGFIKNYDQLISYLRKLWNKKYQPKELR